MINETEAVAEVEELTIGRWGLAWQQFMTENHPTEAAELQTTER